MTDEWEKTTAEIRKRIDRARICHDGTASGHFLALMRATNDELRRIINARTARSEKIIIGDKNG